MEQHTVLERFHTFQNDRTDLGGDRVAGETTGTSGSGEWKQNL